MKVKVIIDLIDYIKPEDVIKHSNDFEYINEPVADFPDNNINWAEKLAAIIEKRIKDNQVVYVHCVQGMSRSAALILYYLITREHKTMREAFDFVKSIRPVLCPTFGFMTGLCELDTKVHGKSSFSLDEYAINCLNIKEVAQRANFCPISIYSFFYIVWYFELFYFCIIKF